MTNLRRCSPALNGTAYMGMLLENLPRSPIGALSFGPELAGPGPYYESQAIDEEIWRLNELYRREREAHAANLKEQQKCEAEVSKLKARTCWLKHAWAPWRDAGTHTTAFLGRKELTQTIPVQERRCLRCNMQQLREVRV